MLQLHHPSDQAIEVRYGDVSLFSYVYRPQYDAIEAIKPYMHPINTLKGNLATVYRPWDHVWHKGLQMTQAVLSGENFWGGGSFVRDKGYVMLPNIGRMQHEEWQKLEAGEMVERLTWITQAGEKWIDERRTIRVAEVKPAEGYWALEWSMSLTNTAGRELRFGSPTTEGRPMAGYGGLFWRGPRAWTKGKIFTESVDGPDAMGQRSPWLGFVGRCDGTGDTCTMVFVDRPGNVGYPLKWFVRTEPYACVAFSFSFDEEVPVKPGETLDLSYKILIADGEWDKAKMAAMAK
jgi:hypothetical protein